jgi:chromosome segregation ATPase
MSTEPNLPAPGSSSTGPAAPLQSGDAILSSLVDLESRLTSFKAMHEQHALRDMELAKREQFLTQRESEHASKSDALNLARAELDRQAGEIMASRRHAAEAEARALAAERTIGERVANVERAEADLAEREKTMAAKAVRAEADLNRVAAQQEELQNERRELDATMTEVARREAEVAERAGSLVRDREALDALRTEVENVAKAQQDAQRAREQEIHELEFDISSQRAELERERAGVAEQARTLAAQMKTREDEQNAAIWSTRMETMEMEVGEARGARARLETELAQSRAEIEKLTGELIGAHQNGGVPADEVAKRDQAIEELRSRLEESRAATRMLQEQIDVLDAQARSSTAESAKAIEEREDQLRVQRERLAAHSRQIDAANAAVEKAAAERAAMAPRADVDRLEKELAAARELLDHAEESGRNTVSAEELRTRDARIAELQQSLSQAEKNVGERARAEIESRDAMIAELQTNLEQATSAADVPVDSEELAKRDEAIAILRDRLQQTMAEAAEIRTQVGSAPRTHEYDGGPTASDLKRRDRLRRYKSMLQTQARKIVAAQGALQKRHTDCELILTNRSRLAELAQQLSRAERKLTAAKARSGAAAAMLYIVATTTLLAGLSWEVSKRIWPGTFIARAVVDADVGRRTPKPDDLAVWQKDHSEMLRDPRLMEMASERMKQRGMPALGSAPDLTARLKDDMYIQPGKPGSLTVELRGEGAEKTALVLDTFVTSFKSFADQARDERSNDIGVVIAQAATAGTEPLMDKRLERAGGVFGGAALAAGLAGLVIWSRLVRAKKKFDQAAAVEAALQEVDWSVLEASIKKHAGKEATG